MPTELLGLINDYCAPLAGFRRLVAVAHARSGRKCHELQLYSEAEFRAHAKELMLQGTELPRFMRWRKRALAKYHGTADTPSKESWEERSEAEAEKKSEEEQIAEVVSEMRDALSDSGLLPNDSNYSRRWDCAFADAFFQRFGYHHSRKQVL